MGADNVHGRIAGVNASRSYPASVNESETITDAQAFYGYRPGGCPPPAVSGGCPGDIAIGPVERS
jgi:hypothetical protein